MAAHATQPRPVLNRATVAAVIGALLSLLVTVGVLPKSVDVSGLTETLISVGGVLLAAAPTIGAALAAQRVVTPVASPKDNAGNPLAPVGTLAGDVLGDLAATALAQADSIHPLPTA